MSKQIVKGLDLLDMGVHPTYINGSPAIEIRKALTFCDKNKEIITALLETAFSEEPIIIEVPVSIRFRDKFLAKQKLLEMGIELTHL